MLVREYRGVFLYRAVGNICWGTFTHEQVAQETVIWAWVFVSRAVQ
jgi:hypothetical protein